jgi:hypothetical protein
LETLGCEVTLAGRVDCMCANLAGSVADWVPLLPPNTSKLFLDKNMLTWVPKSSFANLSNLVLISMEDNLLQYVHRDAFQGGQVRTVSLSMTCVEYSIASTIRTANLTYAACVCMRGTECNATNVQPCPKGYFNQFPYTSTCQPCSPGSAAQNIFSEKCDPCLPGTYSDSSGARCTSCPPERAWSPAGAFTPDMCTVGSSCPTSTRVCEVRNTRGRKRSFCTAQDSGWTRRLTTALSAAHRLSLARPAARA